MAHIDVYGRTAELEKTVVDAIATRLEERRLDRRYTSMLHEYLDLIPLDNMEKVLCLGCGTGVEIRELLSRNDFHGSVTGVDISADLIENGKSRLREENIDTDIDWIVADATETGLPSDSHDLIVAHTLISHVPSPENVLGEMARILKPTGALAVFDGDYSTMTYGTRDPEYGKLMDEKIVHSLVANPRVMKSLPRVLANLEFRVDSARVWVLADIGRADFFAGSLASLPAIMPNAGLVTQNEIDDFVTEQYRASEDGQFFASTNFCAMIAKPEL